MSGSGVVVVAIVLACCGDGLMRLMVIMVMD